MNCADFEILLCDYLDGTLRPEANAEVRQHLEQCAGCGEMAKDAAAAMRFMERAAEVEPPPELMTRILFELPSAHHARARQPKGIGKLIRGWFQPILQPRFAMGFAMTILSFSLLGRVAGINPRQLTMDDLRPTKVWQALDDKVYRTWQRTKKFYENLRLVYEIQTQLKDWKQKEQELRGRTATEATTAEPGTAQQAPGGARPPQPASNDARNRK